MEFFVYIQIKGFGNQGFMLCNDIFRKVIKLTVRWIEV